MCLRSWSHRHWMHYRVHRLFNTVWSSGFNARRWWSYLGQTSHQTASSYSQQSHADLSILTQKKQGVSNTTTSHRTYINVASQWERPVGTGHFKGIVRRRLQEKWPGNSRELVSMQASKQTHFEPPFSTEEFEAFQFCWQTGRSCQQTRYRRKRKNPKSTQKRYHVFFSRPR